MGKHSTVSLPNYKLEMERALRPYFCDGCKEIGFGRPCSCKKPNLNNLHRDCKSAAMSPDSIPPSPHKLFNSSTWKFHDKLPPTAKGRHCNVCGKSVNGFVFHDETKGLYVHPCCRNLPRSLDLDLNGDDVKFKLHRKVLSKCIYCDRTKVRGSVSGNRGWSYVSERPEFHLHVYCAKEMRIEAWKNGDYDNIRDDIGRASQANSLKALEKVELPIEAQLQRHGRIIKTRKKLYLVFKVSMSFLFGEPLSAINYLVKVLVD